MQGPHIVARQTMMRCI